MNSSQSNELYKLFDVEHWIENSVKTCEIQPNSTKSTKFYFGWLNSQPGYENLYFLVKSWLRTWFNQVITKKNSTWFIPWIGPIGSYFTSVHWILQFFYEKNIKKYLSFKNWFKTTKKRKSEISNANRWKRSS